MHFVLNYAFVLLMVAAASCSKQVSKASATKDLANTWQWVRTDGGIANHIHETPLSTGKNITLKISNNSNSYAIYTNDSLTSQGTYTLEERTCIHDQTNKTFINFSADTDWMIEKIDSENLQLSDESMDGLQSIYKRQTASNRQFGFAKRFQITGSMGF